MKLKNNFFYTLRENAKDEDSISGNLLVKSGFIKKTSAGIYMYMPIGLKVLNKIENIIREEMDKAGAIEMKMPALIAEEYYEKSGRMANFGASVYTLKDRGNKKMVLGPTHEELFVVAAKNMIKSYKHMPFNLYQIQTKFRDEPRARFGLIRVKEFTMKDAYSFDIDSDGMDNSYQKMLKAYIKIFQRLGLKYRIVKADTGMMGGLLSEEFQAISEIGEDTLVYCDDSNFSSNLEIAPCINIPKEIDQNKKGLYQEVYTPNSGTIKEVCDFLKQSSDKFVKCLIYKADDKYYGVLIKGCREVSETKLQKLLNVQELSLAENEKVIELTDAKVGFAGPINLKCPIIMDEEVKYMQDYICGANKTDYHLMNVNNQDFKVHLIADIRQVQEGDLCPISKKPLKFTKGIEVGNIFKLGTKYAESLGLNYLDASNQNKPVWMGSYGIGLGRCLAAYIEQNNDNYGIIFNREIAPYELALIPISTKDEKQMKVAEELYEYFKENQIDCLLDDRDERAGVKFNDIDLIGIPYRITIGKKIESGIVEFKNRKTNETIEINVEEIKQNIKDYLK